MHKNLMVKFLSVRNLGARLAPPLRAALRLASTNASNNRTENRHDRILSIWTLRNPHQIARPRKEPVRHARNVITHLEMKGLTGRFLPVGGRHPFRMFQEKLEQPRDASRGVRARLNYGVRAIYSFGQ